MRTLQIAFKNARSAHARSGAALNAIRNAEALRLGTDIHWFRDRLAAQRRQLSLDTRMVSELVDEGVLPSVLSEKFVNEQ